MTIEELQTQLTEANAKIASLEKTAAETKTAHETALADLVAKHKAALDEAEAAHKKAFDESEAAHKTALDAKEKDVETRAYKLALENYGRGANDKIQPREKTQSELQKAYDAANTDPVSRRNFIKKLSDTEFATLFPPKK